MSDGPQANRAGRQILRKRSHSQPARQLVRRLPVLVSRAILIGLRQHTMKLR